MQKNPLQNDFEYLIPIKECDETEEETAEGDDTIAKIFCSDLGDYEMAIVKSKTCLNSIVLNKTFMKHKMKSLEMMQDFLNFINSMKKRGECNFI